MNSNLEHAVLILLLAYTLVYGYFLSVIRRFEKDLEMADSLAAEWDQHVDDALLLVNH